MIDQAFILAAGLGSRMRPLTGDRPKPMVMVRGRPIIDYAIDSLRACGIKTIAANTHYKTSVINPHLKAQGIMIADEPALLDTGGGIKNALTMFDASKPLLVLSGDSILVGNTGITDLMAAWTDESDIALLLQPLKTMVLTPGVGDYNIKDGKPVRSLERAGDYMWTSARILHPRIFKDTPDDAFSFLPLMDDAEKSGKLSATVHNGVWHHLTTPEDVERVNKS